MISKAVLLIDYDADEDRILAQRRMGFQTILGHIAPFVGISGYTDLVIVRTPARPSYALAKLTDVEVAELKAGVADTYKAWEYGGEWGEPEVLGAAGDQGCVWEQLYRRAGYTDGQIVSMCMAATPRKREHVRLVLSASDPDLWDVARTLRAAIGAKSAAIYAIEHYNRAHGLNRVVWAAVQSPEDRCACSTLCISAPFPTVTRFHEQEKEPTTQL